MTTKNPRGAGRKPKTDSLHATITIRLPVELATQIVGSKSTFIRQAIKEKLNSKAIDQIQALVDKNCPDLEQDEWDTLERLYKDEPFPAFKTDINIAHDLMQNYGRLETKEKMLVSKLRRLTYVEQLAALYIIQGWRQ